MHSCGSCAKALPDDARFCPSCGLEVAPRSSEERRIVTVLFADIVGYTGLTEHLDPELVKRFIDGAFERLIADIKTYGGRVDKVLGDGILALFGAPVSHEDDPDRAIRAALAMHLSLADFVASSDLPDAVELRIGINTGEVLVGRVGGTDDYTAMGDVVNVASRLQTLAPPGGIYVGHSTAELTSDEILREMVDDLEVRGREQTEKVWRVTGRRRGAAPITSTSDVAFVGRTEPLEVLRSIMSLVANGRSAIASVSGEAGVGKTRFVTEALQEFPGSNVVVFAGVCVPYGDTNVWSPIATALFSRMEVDAGLPDAELRQLGHDKGVEIYGFEPADPVLHWFVEAVLHLSGRASELDHVPPAQARETLFRLMVEGLRRRSQLGPVVLWLDDIQWADTLLIDLLTRIARSLADRPILVITAQRDDAELPWPPADHPVTVRLPLDPLTRQDAEDLIGAVMGRPPTATLAAQLFERSGGNPLFLTQLAELAVHDQSSTELPRSLRALIATRLDALPVAPRAVIDNAAVLGSGGPVYSLELFANFLGQPFDGETVSALVEAGFFVIDDGWYRFRSDVVREVAYQTMTKAVRAERHAGTAEVMRGLAGIPVDSIAHHTASAAELVAEVGAVAGVPGDISAQAITVLGEAARRSLDVGAFNQAKRHATRGINLAAADDPVVRELLLVRAEAASERREARPAQADAELALALAVEASDCAQEGMARRLLGTVAQVDGDLPRARDQLDRSIEIFRSLDDGSQLAKTLGDRGFAEVFGGSLADAETFLVEAETLAEGIGDLRLRAWAHQHQAWVAFLSGDPQLAEQRLATADVQFTALGDQSGKSWVRALQAYLHFFQRRFDEAEALANRVRSEALALGDIWAPAMMDSLIASIRLWSGHFGEAEALTRRALVGFRELGDRFGIVQALAPRNRALVALGRTNEAERGLEEALALSDSFGDLAFPTMTAAGTAVHLGLGERAVRLAESAVEQIRAMGANAAEPRVTLAMSLCQAGQPERAMTELLDVEVDFPYAYAVRSMAAAMIGDHGQALHDVQFVTVESGASYLDLVMAHVAGAAASRATGLLDASRQHLTDADTVATDAGDAVAMAFVEAATNSLSGSGTAPAPRVLGPGWVRVVRLLAGQ